VKLRSKIKAWNDYAESLAQPEQGAQPDQVAQPDQESGARRSLHQAALGLGQPSSSDGTGGGGGAPSSLGSLEWQSSTAFGGQGRHLPPGWSAVMHQVPSGPYKRYVGPGGQKAVTIKAAWEASGHDRQATLLANMTRTEVGAASAANLSAGVASGGATSGGPCTALMVVPAADFTGELGGVEWMDGVRLERSAAASTGYRGVYLHRSSQNGKTVVSYLAKGTESAPPNWNEGSVRFRRESRHLGTYPTAREAAVAVAKHAVRN
jgi:hypothetical protein